ncbi:hypothetical protein [uncultured Methanobrevibacter sp.]|uniref:hypothetical protein n=1 Tax=uncultured Methanobrevibacter sp. TaxID=253161 RepID=UPI0025FD54BE|nr:hypothetical protein [uncultured Methanobrevibacter sp.]
MDKLEERNLVWNLVELIIEKHRLENSSEFIDPIAEDRIVFGNFVKGHPMSFTGDFEQLVIEITRKLPGSYEIARDYMLDDASGVVGIVKI